MGKVKFKELKEYLESKACFGFTVSRRKHTLLYSFIRYYNKKNLSLKVKVMRKSKYVMSVMIGDKIYTDLDEVKKIVEK